ncbi:MAG: YggT family protein [Thermodesulfobacteriota bacterium]
MYIFSSFMGAVVGIINILLTMYFWVVIISALMSWVRPDPYHPVVRFLRAVTEPVFYRIRRLMPFVMVGGFDLSPVVVILAIQFVQMFLTYLVSSYAGHGMMVR